MSALEPTDPARPGGTPGIMIMILGAATTVLGPLFGLLAGSMAGSPDPNSTGQLFQYFVIGLFVGAVGVVIISLGFVRYRRWSRGQKEEARAR
ncbi:hypothetical protein [Tessaracoccus antarcticus]|uniref:Uncharacterized protein n=1 Tax=Tessaracoccus antarcticus TaxID=2479848 RepID=A0A3M0G8J5_9ACTN|nr:hypothetical protein [Tessaracoccus antarcticus]RMB61295.1 hypothetical protein EAX62_01085 [Tessaracoccus antarcticus]